MRNALLNTNLDGGKRWNTVESKANLIYLSDSPLMLRGRTDRANPFRENQPMESSAAFCMNGQGRRRTWRPEWAAKGARDQPCAVPLSTPLCQCALWRRCPTTPHPCTEQDKCQRYCSSAEALKSPVLFVEVTNPFMRHCWLLAWQTHTYTQLRALSLLLSHTAECVVFFLFSSDMADMFRWPVRL